METSGILTAVCRFLPTARRLKTLDLAATRILLSWRICGLILILFSTSRFLDHVITFSVSTIGVAVAVCSFYIQHLAKHYIGEPMYDKRVTYLSVTMLVFDSTVCIVLLKVMANKPADLSIPSLLVVCLGVFGALFFLAVLWIGVGNHLNRVWWRQQNQTLSTKGLPEISFQEFMTTKEG